MSSLVLVTQNTASHPDHANPPNPSSSSIPQELVDAFGDEELREYVIMVVGEDTDMLRKLQNFHAEQLARDRSASNKPGWCICGYCKDHADMAPKERKCCRRRNACVNRSNRCRKVCLDSDIVKTAVNSNADTLVRTPCHDNRGMRHTAYRQYVMWMHGNLGKNNCVVIPACVVWMIRDKWPSPDGKYTGYKDPGQK